MIYAGINSRRAARHHQSLIDKAVAAQMPVRKRKAQERKLRSCLAYRRCNFPLKNGRAMTANVGRQSFKPGDLFDDANRGAHLAPSTREALRVKLRSIPPLHIGEPQRAVRLGHRRPGSIDNS